MTSTHTTTNARRDHTKNPGTTFAVVTWLIRRTPYRVLSRMAQLGGFIHYRLARRKRRNYIANTSQAVVLKRHTRPWSSFQNHALNILELLKAITDDPANVMGRLVLRGAEHIDRALDRGDGLILTTLHTGNWELSGLLLAMRGYPITTVAGTQLRDGWSREIKGFKERFGIDVVSPTGSMRQLYRALESNRVLVLHLDGDIFSGGVPGTLLGRDIMVPRGPAHLSRVLGTPTAFAYCRRERDDRLRVFIEPPEAVPDTAADEMDLTRRLVARMEKCILEDPGQWCIFRKL